MRATSTKVFIHAPDRELVVRDETWSGWRTTKPRVDAEWRATNQYSGLSCRFRIWSMDDVDDVVVVSSELLFVTQKGSCC